MALQPDKERLPGHHTRSGTTPDGKPLRAPVSADRRIASLDFIRGFAVMGILAANIIVFGQPFDAYTYPNAFLTAHGEVSDWLLVAQYVVIDSKMRGLFTLLFGAGLYLFMERAWAKGSSRWLQLWRLAILACFGLAHFFFVWRGDILFGYAVLAVGVLPLLRLRPVTQLGLGVTAFVAGAVLTGAELTFSYLLAETALGNRPDFVDDRRELVAGKLAALADGRVEAQMMMAGDYASLVRHNLSEHLFDPLNNAAFFALETLPLMLIGVALYRLGFFSGALPRTAMVRWGWAGLLAGGAASLAIALWLKSQGYTYYLMFAGYVGWARMPQLLMTLGLASLLVVYSQRWTGWLAQRVSAAGRVAFTNYLGTSVLMVAVFQGWGLGLFGELNRPQLYLVAVAGCVVMLAWSKPWLDRFRYGPLEWLWRCLTYRRVFPIRR